LDLECYPCLMRQMIDLLSFGKVKGKKSYEIFFKAYDYLRYRHLDDECLYMGNEIYLIFKREACIEDPCKEIKDISNKQSLKIYPWLKKIINDSDSKLKVALKIAIAGNVIDVGAGIDLKLKDSVTQTINQGVSERYFRDFIDLLARANLILFLGDNAGEVIFDKIFLEEIRKISKNKIYYAVKEKPYLNDAMKEDAIFARVDSVAEVISNGSDCAGTQLHHCSESFVEKFSKADLIISKGYANYMSLKSIKAPIFFLLKVKCLIMQKDFEADKASIVFTKSKNFSSHYKDSNK